MLASVLAGHNQLETIGHNTNAMVKKGTKKIFAIDFENKTGEFGAMLLWNNESD